MLVKERQKERQPLVSMDRNEENGLIEFDLLCCSNFGERIYLTGYCPFDRGPEVPTVSRRFPRRREDSLFD